MRTQQQWQNAKLKGRVRWGRLLPAAVQVLLHPLESGQVKGERPLHEWHVLASWKNWVEAPTCPGIWAFIPRLHTPLGWGYRNNQDGRGRHNRENNNKDYVTCCKKRHSGRLSFPRWCASKSPLMLSLSQPPSKHGVLLPHPWIRAIEKQQWC